MLDQMTLFTTKFHFNYLTHRLHLLTQVCNNLMCEVYANIPRENIFSDQYFLKYVTGWAKMQQGSMLTAFDFTLPGNVKYNGADMITRGSEEMKAVEEEIKAMSNVSWFIMVRK